MLHWGGGGAQQVHAAPKLNREGGGGGASSGFSTALDGSSDLAGITVAKCIASGRVRWRWVKDIQVEVGVDLYRWW